MRALSLLALLLTGCSSASPPLPRSETAKPQVKDNSSLLPLAGRVSAATVPDHVLGLPKLPGGTVGDYVLNGHKYQLFVIDTPSNQDAAIMLLDAKAALTESKMIPWMGGYAGMSGTTPLFVFPKLHYLAGVAGLSPQTADPIARELAARLK